MKIGKTRTNQPVEGGQEFEDALLDSETSFENIVDKDGHKRFIEGNGAQLSLEGFNVTYCKWSLSGTHLMFVLAGTIANGTVVPANSPLATFTLPEWIYNKIYKVWGVNAIEMRSIPLYGNDWTSQSVAMSLIKSPNAIVINAGFTATADRNFRVSYDLLIDNE